MSSNGVFEFEDDDDLMAVRAQLVTVEDDEDQENEENTSSKPLWRNLPSTRQSAVDSTLSKQEVEIQEAIYELIRTEETYLRRLLILQEHFADNLKLMLSNRDWKQIFQHVNPMLQTSHRFLEDIIAERRRSWGTYIPVIDFCRVVRRHAECDFDFYITYCSNQIYHQRSLKQLKAMYPVVAAHIRHLETNNRRGSESSRTLESYLLLPVQRITLLPLLMDAIARNLDQPSQEHHTCLKVALKLRQIVELCNERAREIELREEMLILGNQLDFEGLPAFGLVTEKRFLVKKGQLKTLHVPLASRVSYVDSAVSTHRWLKTLWLFLFNDVIIVARKRKRLDRYKVLTYCGRNLAVIFDDSSKIAEVLPEDFDLKGFQLCLLQNHHNSTQEFILFASDNECKQCWVEVLGSKSKLHLSYPKIYQEWDCPQMKVIVEFEAAKAEELTLREGDIVEILEKRSDGWCYGLKVGEEGAARGSGGCGWFPRSHLDKVASVYERAKIVRRNYLKARRRKLEDKSITHKRTTFYLPLKI